MKNNTFIYTNYKRQDQLIKIIENTRRLFPSAVIKVWDNSEEQSFPRSLVDEVIGSSYNYSTSPRWWMASVAQTYFVTIMDDDFMFTNRAVIDRCVQHLANYHDAVGLFGVNLDNGSYSKGKHIFGIDSNVDIIKGRFFMTKSHFLTSIPAIPPRSEDDIIISSYFKGRCGIIHASESDVVNLKEEHALWKRPDHMDRRDITVKRYFIDQ